MKRTTKKEARANGDVKYYTGKPCKNGHIAERYAKGGNCTICLANNVRRYYQENKEKVGAQCKQYQKDHAPEIKEKQRKKYHDNLEESRRRARENYHKNGDKLRARSRELYRLAKEAQSSDPVE